MPSSIRIDSVSRLHIILVDGHGSFSHRVDGGAGITLQEPSIGLIAKKQANKKITLTNNPKASITSEFLKDTKKALQKIQNIYDLGGVELFIERTIPMHAGFGSKTQALLSASIAYLRLYQTEYDHREIAHIVGRGGTSGIGVEAFVSGGFLVDCGHSFESKNFSFKPSSASTEVMPAPLVGRYQFPDWPILIVTPNERKQIHGDEEQKSFDQVCPIPLANVQACSHIVLMMLIPSVIEANLEVFCEGINLIQELNWKKFQIDAHPTNIRKTIEFLRQIGLQGVGMSSEGATIFGLGNVLNDEVSSEKILQQVHEFLSCNGGGISFITKANNIGAKIIEDNL